MRSLFLLLVAGSTGTLGCGSSMQMSSTGPELNDKTASGTASGR
jgi:hypothetical protein